MKSSASIAGGTQSGCSLSFSSLGVGSRPGHNIHTRLKHLIIILGQLSLIQRDLAKCVALWHLWRAVIANVPSIQKSSKRGCCPSVHHTVSTVTGYLYINAIGYGEFEPGWRQARSICLWEVGGSCCPQTGCPGFGAPLDNTTSCSDEIIHFQRASLTIIVHQNPLR